MKRTADVSAAAAELGRRRMAGMTDEEREQFARAGGHASAAVMSKAARIERARRAGSAPKKKRRKV